MRKIIGSSLIIVGIIVIILGYQQFAVCAIPAQIVGQPAPNSCGDHTLGYVIVFTGLGISFSGIVFLIISHFKK